MKLSWNTFDRSWGHGKMLVEDFKKRIPNVLRDSKLPNDKKKINLLIKWIEKNGFLPADIQLGNKIVNIKVTVPTIVRLHPIYETRVEQLSLTRTII